MPEYIRLTNRQAFMRQTNAHLEQLQRQEQELSERLQQQKTELERLTPLFITLLGIFSAILTGIFGSLDISLRFLAAVTNHGTFGIIALLALIWLSFVHLLNFMYGFISTVTSLPRYALPRQVTWITLAAAAGALVLSQLSCAELTGGLRALQPDPEPAAEATTSEPTRCPDTAAPR